MESLNFKQRVIAHRGASGYAPENTLAAFEKAADLRIEWIELDVALTKDNHPIIIHDDTLDRTTNGVGEVGCYTLAELKKLDAGSWFASGYHQEKLPTLTQLISFLEKTNMKANIELKSLPGREKALVHAVLNEMSTYLSQYNHRILFSSFSVPTLMLLREAAPNVSIGLLMERWLPDWQGMANQLNSVAIHVDKEIVTATHAKEVKAQGRQFLCYTVDEPSEANLLLNIGIDAIFTNVPDRVLGRE